MDSKSFFDLMIGNLEFPFEIEEVKSIESNCGTTWIELNNGVQFYLAFEQCSRDDEESQKNERT